MFILQFYGEGSLAIYRFLKHCSGSGKDAKLLMLLTGMGKINSANLLTTFKLRQFPLLSKTKSHGQEARPRLSIETQLIRLIIDLLM